MEKTKRTMTGKENVPQAEESKENAERCPFCMGYHGIIVRTIDCEYTNINGRRYYYTAEYTFCPFTYEYYETEEQLRKNVQALLEAEERKMKELIPQEDITKLLIKFEKNARPYDMD